jgi:hypothetical protein
MFLNGQLERLLRSLHGLRGSSTFVIRLRQLGEAL